MKNAWKVFEFDKYDILVEKTFQEDAFRLQYSLCMDIGNTISVSFECSDRKNLDEVFDKQDHGSVKIFADYLVDTLGGAGIFKGSGPDEIEVHMKPLKLKQL